MQTKYDLFGQIEKPYVVLCNPNREQIHSLNAAYAQKLNYKYNAVSVFTFSFARSVDNGETTLAAYDDIKIKRLILIENFGYFIISDVDEDLKGSIPIKNVTANSLESQMSNRKLTSFGGTMRFYDPISPESSMLYRVLELVPNWSIGYIDSDLWDKYRTFDINDTTVYNFLVSDAEKAYECVFVFDTVNRTVNAYTNTHATTSTDIFVSFDTLVENVSLKEMSDEIVTCMYVFGGGDLDISTVNPLGNTRMYDFTYYKNTGWMSAGLVSAISLWETKVAAAQVPYANLLTQLKNRNAELLGLESGTFDNSGNLVSKGMAQLKSEIEALQAVLKVQVEQKLNTHATKVLINAKQVEINQQQTLINNKQAEIDGIRAQLTALNATLKFDVNFTPTQLSELEDYIIENTYQNNNIIQTDIMTNEEIQAAAQELYDQAKNVLAKASMPHYEFTAQMSNFTAMPEFQYFTNQLTLGCEITIDLGAYTITSVLLSMELNFDDPSDFVMTFSNRLRLSDAGFVFSDLFGNIVKTGSTVNFGNMNWNNWTDEYKDDVSLFIHSSLNASLNNLKSSTNEEIVINGNGLVGKRIIPGTKTYRPQECWLTSNTLAFTNDSWDTASLALGLISVNGTNFYGLVADAVVGKLLAGNSLQITNSGPGGIVNFTLDNNGCILNNAAFTVQNTKNKIFLDPAVGIKVQTNVGGTWTDRFVVDSATGNVLFSGELRGATGTFTGGITAATGNIGGWIITSTGIQDKATSPNNFIRSDGSVHLGGLSIDVSGNAVFTGKITATSFTGKVIGLENIIDQAISSAKIRDNAVGDQQVSSLTGGVISGGVIDTPGLKIELSGTGVPRITTKTGVLEIGSGSYGLDIRGSGVTLGGASQLNLGLGETISMRGSLRINNVSTISQTVSVGPSYLNKTLTFTNGLLTYIQY